MAGVGWVLIIVLDLTAAAASGHSMHMSAAMETVGRATDRPELWRTVLHSSLMVPAMMAPLLSSSLAHITARVSRTSRRLAIGLATAGYGLVWSAGTGALVIASQFSPVATSPWAALIAVALAVCWHSSPLRQRCFNRRHAQVAIPAYGRPAATGALRFGVRAGSRCLGSCAAPMVIAVTFHAQSIAAMAAATLWIWADSIERSAQPRWHFHIPQRALRMVIALGRRRTFLALPVDGRRQ